MRIVENRPLFWIVWNPQGRNPTYQHSNYEHACKEAARLANANPDQQFFVMESCVLARFPKQIVFQTFGEHDYDEIPF